MNRLLKRFLVSLHSEAWKDRFGAEYQELMDRRPLDGFEFFDGLRSSLQSRISDLHVKDLPPVFLIVAGSAFSGYINLHTDEVQPTVFLIVFFTFVLTAWRPKHWWAWMIIAALSVPSSYLLANMAHIAAVDPPANFWSTLIAFIPAAIAAALGLGVRRIVDDLS